MHLHLIQAWPANQTPSQQRCQEATAHELGPLSQGSGAFNLLNEQGKPDCNGSNDFLGDFLVPLFDIRHASQVPNPAYHQIDCLAEVPSCQPATPVSMAHGFISSTNDDLQAVFW